jgi:hypothetical protein
MHKLFLGFFLVVLPALALASTPSDMGKQIHDAAAGKLIRVQGGYALDAARVYFGDPTSSFDTFVSGGEDFLQTANTVCDLSKPFSSNYNGASTEHMPVLYCIAK